MIISKSQDVIGIFDSITYEQYFVTARPIKVSVSEVAKVMTHPVENGATISDFKVIMPIQIQMSMILSPLEYQATYQSIKTAFKNSTLFIVQTRSDMYLSMMISAMPHEEEAAMFDTIPIALKMEEVKLATTIIGVAKHNKVSNPKSKKHSDTTKTGKQNEKTTDATKQKYNESVLHGWLS